MKITIPAGIGIRISHIELLAISQSAHQSGHSSKYRPGPTLLNISDRTETGASTGYRRMHLNAGISMKDYTLWSVIKFESAFLFFFLYIFCFSKMFSLSFLRKRFFSFPGRFSESPYIFFALGAGRIVAFFSFIFLFHSAYLSFYRIHFISITYSFSFSMG